MHRITFINFFVIFLHSTVSKIAALTLCKILARLHFLLQFLLQFPGVPPLHFLGLHHCPQLNYFSDWTWIYIESSVPNLCCISFKDWDRNHIYGVFRVTGQNGSEQNGTAKWYGQNGIRTKWYRTKWYSQRVSENSPVC